jgi:hypothetical protein
MFARRGQSPRRLAVLPVMFAVVACALAGARGAAAASPTAPSDNSAVSQYVETVPSSNGGEAVGAGVSESTQLSQHALDAIVTRGGRDAGLLQMIATSTYYGAPSEPLRTSPDAHAAGVMLGARLWVIVAIVTLAAGAAAYLRGRRPAQRPPVAE